MNKPHHNVLLALGTIGGDDRSGCRLRRMVRMIRTMWSGVEETAELVNPAIGDATGTLEYTNQLVRFSTSESYEEVYAQTKAIERMCGRISDGDKSVADLDILSFDDVKYHQKDWGHQYIQTLLRSGFKMLLTVLLLANVTLSHAQEQTSVTDLLGKAIEYFSGQKYHEALLTFAQIEKTHRLTPRFQAYKGVCQFKMEEYENAIETLEPVAKLMTSFSPHEQAVYYYAWGESYFQLGRYFETVPCFQAAFGVSNESDRAEICYRLGFSQMMCAEYEDAIYWFREAERWYGSTEKDELTEAHREQGRRMLKALIAKTDYKR